jgi:hypothetical protein
MPGSVYHKRELTHASLSLTARRKSVYSYNFSAGVDTPDVIEAPSQTETITESQSTQDDMMSPSVPERTKLPVPSSSSQCDIPDVPVREG